MTSYEREVARQRVPLGFFIQESNSAAKHLIDIANDTRPYLITVPFWHAALDLLVRRNRHFQTMLNRYEL